MKRIFALLFVLLLLCSSALADDQQLVGVWYMATGLIDDLTTSNGIYSDLEILIFTDSNIIMTSSYKMDKNGITIAKDYHSIGFWFKIENKYYYSIPGEDLCELAIENGTLFFPINDYYWGFHKIIEVDYDNDVRTR